MSMGCIVPTTLTDRRRTAAQCPDSVSKTAGCATTSQQIQQSNDQAS
jgi:hypothetical protein